MKKNSPQAWIQAMRPNTLAGAAAPILIALGKAFHDAELLGKHFQWFPALLCLLFAFLMQIDANLINDYFDYIKGVDREDRLGPPRACAQGWISVENMRIGIAITTLLACLVGMPLIWYGGSAMIAVGVVCVIFCFLYTTTMAKRGLGDILVLVFFGIIPVCITYFIQMQTIGWTTLLLSLGIGLITDTLLIVNNYRDRETDVRSNKITLVVLIGERNAESLYKALGVLGFACCIPLLASPGGYYGVTLSAFYLILHLKTWKKMVAINKGKELNRILGETARNIFIFGLLTTIGLLFF